MSYSGEKRKAKDAGVEGKNASDRKKNRITDFLYTFPVPNLVAERIAPFLEPKDVLNVMKIEQYEKRFHLKKHYCAKDGCKYHVDPKSVDDDEKEFTRTCTDCISGEEREITEQVSDFVQEEGTELICPECHSCETCGDVYALGAREELLDFCSDCGMFWCCAKDNDHWSAAYTGEYPNSQHQYCGVCHQVHCLRSSVEDGPSRTDWFFCTHCQHQCNSKCNQKRQEQQDVRYRCNYGDASTGFKVQGRLCCSDCHDGYSTRDCWSCFRKLCGCTTHDPRTANSLLCPPCKEDMFGYR